MGGQENESLCMRTGYENTSWTVWRENSESRILIFRDLWLSKAASMHLNPHQRPQIRQSMPIIHPKPQMTLNPAIPNIHRCSIGSSGNSSSTSLTTHLSSGGLTNPLNKNVPYTNSAKPRTCNHLNDSQPRKRDTIQIKSVRQVSIVERAVAETVRVTESPKKLNPLAVLALQQN